MNRNTAATAQVSAEAGEVYGDEAALVMQAIRSRWVSDGDLKGLEEAQAGGAEWKKQSPSRAAPVGSGACAE